MADPLFLDLRVVPNAGRNQLAGVHGAGFKVKVRAPAVDGKANAALIDFLAEALGLRASRFRLVSGEKSRTKRVAISDLGEAEKAEILRRMKGESTA